MKINLYWFRSKPNIGDSASYFIVKHLVASYPIQYKNPGLSFWGECKKIIVSLLKGRWPTPAFSSILYPWEKCLMAAGSIMDRSKRNVVVWGSGFREYSSVFKRGYVYATRGYLSRDKLPAEFVNVPVGDPALLLPLIIDGKYPDYKQDVRGLKRPVVIPHYYDYDAVTAKLQGKYDVLDVRTDDVESFVAKLRQYDCVFSSSLHGIIIAHSFGIPALWMKCGNINSGPFKFHDYFSSVGIQLYDGLDCIDALASGDDSWKRLFADNWCKILPGIDIKTLSDNLLASFPYK